MVPSHRELPVAGDEINACGAVCGSLDHQVGGYGVTAISLPSETCGPWLLPSPCAKAGLGLSDAEQELP